MLPSPLRPVGDSVTIASPNTVMFPNIIVIRPLIRPCSAWGQQYQVVWLHTNGAVHGFVITVFYRSDEEVQISSIIQTELSDVIQDGEI